MEESLYTSIKKVVCMLKFFTRNNQVVNVSEAKKKMKEEEYYLMDVRSYEEFISGHIPSSRNIPLDQLQTSSKLPKRKEKLLFVYCASGARSANALLLLKHMGYTNVYDLGGIHRWDESLERGSSY